MAVILHWRFLISGTNPPMLTQGATNIRVIFVEEYPFISLLVVSLAAIFVSSRNARSEETSLFAHLLWFALLSCDKVCQFRYTFVFCRTYEENPEEAINQCHILLEEPDLETAVRVGDVYGVIIEHYARQQNYSKVSFRPRLVCVGVLKWSFKSSHWLWQWTNALLLMMS